MAGAMSRGKCLSVVQFLMFNFLKEYNAVNHCVVRERIVFAKCYDSYVKMKEQYCIMKLSDRNLGNEKNARDTSSIYLSYNI